MRNQFPDSNITGQMKREKEAYQFHGVALTFLQSE
jgi:hypothetical protein